MLRALVVALLVVTACGLSSRPDSGSSGGGNEGGGGGTSGSGGGSTGGGSNGGTAGGGTAGGGAGAAPTWHLDEVATGISTPRLLAVHGQSATDFWVLSADGTVFHSNGSTFTAVSGATGATALVSTSAGEVFLAGPGGPLSCATGCRAPGAFFDLGTLNPSGTTLYGACASPEHGAFVSGTNSSGNTGMYHFKGGLWDRVWYGSNVQALRGCFVDAFGRAWATGDEELMGTLADGGWSEEPASPSFSDEQWLTGAATDAGRVIGGAGWRIATKEPAVGFGLYQKVSSPPDAGGSVRAITRLGAGNDVFAGGTFEGGRSMTIRRDGQWRTIPNVPVDVWGAWGVGRDELFIAGGAADGGSAAVLFHATWN